MSDERKRIYPPNPYPYSFIDNYLKPPAPDLLRCTRCKQHLAEPRFYVEVIGRNIYHRHCASEIARKRSDSVAVPLDVAKTLVRARYPWHLLEYDIRLDWRNMTWGCFWTIRDVRRVFYVCLVPCVPLRLVLGPRLHQPDA